MADKSMEIVVRHSWQTKIGNWRSFKLSVGNFKLSVGEFSWRRIFFRVFMRFCREVKPPFFWVIFLGGIPIYRGWILEVWHRLHMSGIWRFLKKMIFYPKFCDNSRWTSWMEEMSTWKSCSNHAAFTGYSGTWMEQPPQNGRVYFYRKWLLASPLFKIIFALQYFREWRKLL